MDEPPLRAFVVWQISEGLHFLVTCGSTGEAATMSLDEYRRVVEITVEQAKDRVPVAAGAPLQRHAEGYCIVERDGECRRNASAAYVADVQKPRRRGIADAVNLAMVVDNVPSRTGSNVEAAATLELTRHENMIAVKEASGLRRRSPRQSGIGELFAA